MPIATGRLGFIVAEREGGVDGRPSPSHGQMEKAFARLVGLTMVVIGLTTLALGSFWASSAAEDHEVFEGTDGRFEASGGRYVIMYSESVDCDSLEVEVVRIDGGGADLVTTHQCPLEGSSEQAGGSRPSGMQVYSQLELVAGVHEVSASEPVIIADREALADARWWGGLLLALSGFFIAPGISLIRLYRR